MAGDSAAVVRGADEHDRRQMAGDAARPQPLNLLQLLIGASAVIGGIAYAVIRIILNAFYGAFGVSPEEVGWNAGTGLTRFGPYLVWLVVAAAVSVVRFQEGRLMRAKSLSEFFKTGPSIFIFLASMLIGYGFLMFFARQNATNVRNGVAPGPPLFVPCVQISWFEADNKTSLAPIFNAERRFFLFGDAGGTTVLYDSTANTTLRVPTSRLVLRSCQK